jgi:thiol-disulfide isomerase/thioredoxin
MFLRIKFVVIIFLLTSCQADRDFLLQDGKAVSFGGAKGQWTIINYWAIWCAPCRHEIPELNRFALDYENEYLLLGVNFDGAIGGELSKQTQELGIEFNNLLEDPRVLWELDRPNVLPETLIIDEEGQLRHRLVGPQDYESLVRLLNEKS